MRGADTFTESLFAMRKLEDFVSADHPLRPIRQMINAALVKMDMLFSAWPWTMRTLGEMLENEAQNAENGSKRIGKFMMRKDEVKNQASRVRCHACAWSISAAC